jgi:hypothetical protein
MESAWAIRPYNSASDENFILDSWLNAYRTSPWAGTVPNNKYFEVYGEAVRELISRGSIVRVACNPDKPDQILGWLCYEVSARGDKCVHFVYVKDLFRKLGICRALFKTASIDPKSRFYYTHRTKLARLFENAVYEPAIARRRQA